MILSFGYVIVRLVLQLGALAGRGDRANEVKILVLRHQVAVLRPHQGRHQLPPNKDQAPALLDLAAARVKRRTILGGLISEYSQAA